MRERTFDTAIVKGFLFEKFTWENGVEKTDDMKKCKCCPPCFRMI